MMRWLLRAVVVLLCLCCFKEPAIAADWPQFRGPNASGHAATAAKLPAEIGPSTNVIWKIPFPPGHSSPVLAGDRIYLTAVRDRKLRTLALDRGSGKVLWEAEAPATDLEKIHSIGSHAQCSPAADSECVVSFFGSSGLFCYDRNGKLLWQKPMGPFKNDFGAGASPIITGERVLLYQDHDQDSFLMALDRHTGKVLWKTERPDILRNYCTPVIWEVNGKKQIVVAGTLRVAGYDLDSGEEVWTVRGIARTVCMTPVVGDGNLYAAGWSAGGDAGERIRVAPFDSIAGDLDRNKNGTLEDAELPAGDIKQRFTQVDADKDGSLTRKEYERFRELFDKGQNVVLAIRPGGKGDVTDSHVLWKSTRYVPFCASPLHVNGKIFTVKDGGVVSSLDARDGTPLKQERVPATGDYYSSPVTGDGKIYLLNVKGQLTVISAEADWKVLAAADFEEDTYATPALADGRIYLRTVGHLYCFGLK
jgi:outer membrane protein assembly factor BamB